MRRLLIVVLLVAGCIPHASPSPTAAPTASATPISTVVPAPSGSAAACAPTDQDQHVYNPTRLVVLAPCERMTGTVAAIRHEADGDYHVLIAPDPAYAGLVNAANSGLELGDLVVEPVCVAPVTQADAVAACQGNTDPVSVAGLAVGQHVWAEGRYVTDSDHGGWAELHPLYRWGPQAGQGVPLPSETPPPVNDEAP